METITNLASTAATTASKLIYGDQPKTEEAVEQTKDNETAGKEPISLSLSPMTKATLVCPHEV